MYVFTTGLCFWLQYPNCENKISGSLHPWFIGFDTVAVNYNTTCSVIKNFWRCEGLITFSSNFLKNFLLHFFLLEQKEVLWKDCHGWCFFSKGCEQQLLIFFFPHFKKNKCVQEYRYNALSLKPIFNHLMFCNWNNAKHSRKRWWNSNWKWLFLVPWIKLDCASCKY